MTLLALANAFMLQTTKLFCDLMDERPFVRVQVWRELEFVQSRVLFEGFEQFLEVISLLLILVLLLIRNIHFLCALPRSPLESTAALVVAALRLL